MQIDEPDYYSYLDSQSSLSHHGIIGQKWGIRRFQNEDGSLTNQGKTRYASDALSSASNFINSFKGKSLNDVKIDALDVANRKGLLDFLDSKADAPFTNVIDYKERYQSSSKKDVFKAMSNLDRYLDMREGIGKSKPAHETRADDQKSFSKMLKSYIDSDANNKGFVDAILNASGQSVEDKKLGMISKDARDIDRQSKAKELIDTLSKKNFDVADLSNRWYKTDVNGNLPSFQGQASKYHTEKVPVKNYETVVTPEHIKEGFTRYFRMPGDTRTGLYGTQTGEFNNTNKFYKFNDEGYVDLPTKTRIPESRTVQQNGWKLEDRLVYDGPTKAYTDFMEGLHMDTKYSHLTSSLSSSTRKDGSDWLDEFMHSDDASEYLAHHGIRGQKWGNRRYQNSDGSLTTLGRVRYGVGAARNTVGKAAKTAGSAVAGTAKKAGHAIRGKIAPTDQQLYDQYAKAKYKADRKAMKDDINKLKGKKKKLKDMSDQEVIDAINRYRNERTLKALEKDAGKSRARLAIEEAARKGLSDAIHDTTRKALGTMGNKLAESLDSDANKAKRERQRLTDELAIKSLSGDKEEAKRARKALDATQKAVSGKYKKNDDKKNQNNKQNDTQKTNDTNSQKNNNQKNNNQKNNPNKKNDKDSQKKQSTKRNDKQKSEPTYTVPDSSKSKDTSDFFRSKGRGVVTDARPGVDYDIISDHIASLASRQIKALPPARS